MKKSRKEFIKELYDGSFDGLKKRFEKEFPKLFKNNTLVVGRWYYSEGCLFNYQKKSNIYGFFTDGGWNNGGWSWSLNDTNAILVPYKEVEQELIKEAEKRGYENVKINNLESIGNMLLNNHSSISSNCYYYNVPENALWFMGRLIFWNGKWAEKIKETITKEQAEKELGKTILN